MARAEVEMEVAVAMAGVKEGAVREAVARVHRRPQSPIQLPPPLQQLCLAPVTRQRNHC